VSLAGGGTDLSPYCDCFGGAVFNTTIDLYAFAHLSPIEDREIVFKAPDISAEDRAPLAGQLPTHSGLRLHRGVYNRIIRDYRGGEPLPLRLSTTVDAPPGSGLGSSSALVVAMVEAFRSALDLPLGPYEVARLAYEIERIDLKLEGGRQDQYAAAFGGLNFIEFLPGERVVVNPLRMRDADLKELESSLVVCFTGQSRASDAIIHEQVTSMHAKNAQTMEGMHRLKADAFDMKQALLQGDLSALAAILDRSWISKKRTAASITNSRIDHLYNVAKEHGALAGKVSGAGGGGFMTFITDPENRYRLMSALEQAGGAPKPIFVTHRGVEAWATRS
jgi:D-glycero-alpha-D-manno-heptose-7-phosphate kinase